MRHVDAKIEVLMKLCICWIIVFEYLTLQLRPQLTAHRRGPPKVGGDGTFDPGPEEPPLLHASVGLPIQRGVRKRVVVQSEAGRHSSRPGYAGLQRGRVESGVELSDHGILEGFGDPVFGKTAAVRIGVPFPPEAQQTNLHKSKAHVPVVLFPECGYELVQRCGQISVFVVGTFSTIVVVEGESSVYQMLRHGSFLGRIVHKKSEDDVTLP
mmetsp:Transcript_1597/g.3388  ORF Transcript_1597/g.3388 Transcript_1597/m.3388 type:complete len:211 (+) Transcript_1597:1496-2128(+)